MPHNDNFLSALIEHTCLLHIHAMKRHPPSVNIPSDALVWDNDHLDVAQYGPRSANEGKHTRSDERTVNMNISVFLAYSPTSTAEPPSRQKPSFLFQLAPSKTSLVHLLGRDLGGKRSKNTKASRKKQGSIRNKKKEEQGPFEFDSNFPLRVFSLGGESEGET